MERREINKEEEVKGMYENKENETLKRGRNIKRRKGRGKMKEGGR